ncbi:secreted RxLR effector protein 161-like [Rhodamnia argentea]|uniref:Secreted RxLR effector protein 161-like n=1 Tax=Rhodamnia argentea TaxID=178133 RepID=A0A8B8QXB7_9MYRT|nr:secreted RxLR effector protein 161-like [Rhodamnia argentea]
MIQEFKEEMMKTFEMMNLGMMHYFLGIEVDHNKRTFISQKKYAKNLLKKFKMDYYKLVTTSLVTNEKLLKEDGAKTADLSLYRSRVGRLLYLIATQPDIMYATSLLSRFMQSPNQIHFGATKRILRYLRGTTNYGIWYQPSAMAKLIGYTDSDWAGSADDRRSTTNYAFTLGFEIFSWASKNQESVAQSTMEVEYVATATTTSQAI